MGKVTHALHCSLSSMPDLWLVCWLSAKKGGSNFHFSASPWDRYASELATIQWNDSFTLSRILGLYKLDQHQCSYTSLHQPKNMAPYFHGMELSPGRFWAASWRCRLDAPVGIKPCLGGVGFGEAGLLCFTLEKKWGSISHSEWQHDYQRRCLANNINHFRTETGSWGWRRAATGPRETLMRAVRRAGLDHDTHCLQAVNSFPHQELKGLEHLHSATQK